MRLIASVFLALATALSQLALAQDPPTRVGRLAFTEGSVALYQDPDQGWEKAYVNSPVTSENSIWTDPSSRAEVRVSGIAVRLDESTQVDIVKLDEDVFRAFVTQGSVAVRVRHLASDDRIVFATPHARFRLQAAGRYRIDVDADNDETIVTVFTGTALMRSSAGDVRVESGGAMRVRGGSNPSFVRDRARTDAFDRWTVTRDSRWIATRTTQYVSTDMTGYEDLDSHGTWSQEPEYGAVWYPSRVARDWVPYRHGRWDYVRPWGWTWIAEEPWGYAPYHYGRWVYVRDRWGWYPGPRTARPAWAPALVAFVGGSNFSVGISGGSAPALGWYPLAPWERYEPWYRTNTTYVNRVNVSVRDGAPRQWEGRNREEWRYANRDQGATVVRRDAFLGGRSVTQDVVRVTPEVMRQVQVAQPSTILPGPEQFRRPGRVATQPPSAPQPQPVPQATRPGAPATAQAPQSQPPAEAPRRTGERSNPMARPNFGERQAAFGDRPALPAPVPAPTQAPAAAQAPVMQQPAGAPSGRPLGRDDQRTQERATRDAQQAQERAAREAQQAQQLLQRESQERAARDAQQQQQRQGQERATRDAQQAQERAAREAQQAQQQQQQRESQERAARDAQQQQQQQQRQGQERAVREAQQAQERAARDQQQQVQDRARAQERAAQEQQQAQERAAREQQQAQERAAREAQRGQPAAQPPAAPPAGRGQTAAPPPAAPPAGRGQPAQPAAAAPAQPAAAAPAQPPAAAPAQPAAQPRERGRDRDKDKDKDKEDEEKPGKGRGR